MTKQEILAQAEPELTKNALEIAKKRYLKCDLNGSPVETPKEMFYRVAEYMAQAEDMYPTKKDKAEITSEFFKMMAELRFVPGGRILFAADKDTFNQLHSCYVLPIDDSMDSIFQCLKEASIVHQWNGGTGFNFSKIRPKGDVVRNVPGTAFGPIRVIEIFSESLGRIRQGAKRSGANMGILNIDHPDVREFIHMKDSGDKIFNFNVSVGVTDKFMEAVKKDGWHEFKNPKNGEITGKIRARELFDEICENAWRCADPGMIFLDALEEKNPTPQVHSPQDATNPCGEQPLLPYESCNLGSVVLSNHVKDGKIDWDLLRRTVRCAVHMMDNNIDVNNYPLEKIEQMVRFGNRRIGLGVMGLGRLFYKIGVPYNSDGAVRLTEQIAKFITDVGHERSEELAQERGVFPNWAKSKHAESGHRIRNATVTTIAPTGTISMLASTSSGVEPVFSLVTIRRTFFEDSKDMKGASHTQVWADPIFEEELKRRNLYSKELLDRIAEEGSIQHLDEIPEEMKEIFTTTHDIDYAWHVKIQAAAQKYTDNAVSKTINMRHECTIDDVKEAYTMAYESRCLGITVYRDGSKGMQVLNTAKSVKMTNGQSMSPIEISRSEVHEPIRMVVQPAAEITKLPEILPFDREFSENALSLMKRGYLQGKEGGALETHEEMFGRVAKALADIETNYSATHEQVNKWSEQFKEIMLRKEFVPAGRTLTSAGAKTATVANCIVLPIEDSMESIFKTLKDAALLQRQGAGIGFNFSNLRPKGSVIKKHPGKLATGPVSFLKLYNAAFGIVWEADQRRGAYMAMLDVDHPDIEEFVECKVKEGEIVNFNISVCVRDKFMQAVENNADHELIDPITGTVVKTIPARGLFDKLVRHAWANGEPGIAFIDRINETNPVPGLGPIKSSNPCGEQFLHPYDVCNLGSLNLEAFATDDGRIDYERLRYVTRIAIRMLDNVIDDSNFAVPEINKMFRGNRRVGLGIMGFGYMLYRLRLGYNTEEGQKMAEKVMKTINDEAHRTSRELAEEKGVFPNWDKSIYVKDKIKMRNAALTTIAPTGKISMMFDTTSGVEPEFALVYTKKAMDGQEFLYTNQYLEHDLKQLGIYSLELMERISKRGSLQGIDEIPAELKKIYVVSGDISAEDHIRMLAAFQKYVDNSISKTINFPNDAVEDDVRRGYLLAWKIGCKACTVYRDGSRQMQVLNVGDGKENSKVQALTPKSAPPGWHPSPKPRPEVVPGATYNIKTGYGTMFVTVNHDRDGNPFEVFATIGKAGGFFAAKSEAICRLISLAFRSGIPVETVVDQLKGIRGPMPIWTKHGQILSIPDAIANVLETHMIKSQAQLQLGFREGEAEQEPKEGKTKEPKLLVESEIEAMKDLQMPKAPAQVFVKQFSLANAGVAPQCPDCNSVLVFAEGCLSCHGCGYSKCG